MSDVDTFAHAKGHNNVGNVSTESSGGGVGVGGHLEGWQAVQTGEVLDVSCSDLKTRTVPGTAHVSFRQHS